MNLVRLVARGSVACGITLAQLAWCAAPLLSASAEIVLGGISLALAGAYFVMWSPPQHPTPNYAAMREGILT